MLSNKDNRSRFFEAALSAIPDYVYAFNRDYRLVYVNKAMQNLFGEKKEIVGRNFAELNYPPEFTTQLNAKIDKVFESGQPVTGEICYVNCAGVNDYFNISLAPLLATDGSVELVIGISKDMTEWRQQEREMQEKEHYHTFLLALSDALRPLTDAIAIQETTSRMLGEYLNVDRVAYGEMEPDNETVIIARDWAAPGVESINGKFRIQEFARFFYEQLQAGQPALIEDALHDPRVSADAYEHTWKRVGIRSAIACPLVKHGKMIALVSINMAGPRRWTDGDVSVISAVAERTWEAVERARVQAALRNSEMKYRTLFNKMNQGFCVIEKINAAGEPSDYRYVAANPAFERHTQMHDVVGKTILQMVPDAELRIMERYDRVAQTGQPEYFIDYVAPLGLWMEAEVFPAEIPGFIAVLFSDVTERKRAEIALKEREEQLAAVFDALPVAVAFYNQKGEPLLLNQEMIGYLPNQLMPSFDDSRGNRWRAWDDQGNLMARYNFPGARALRGEHVLPGLEMLYTQDDGKEVWTRVAAIPIKDTAGNITAQLCVITDIDELKRTTQALQEAERQLKSFNQILLQQVNERTAELKRSRDQLQSIFDTTLVQMLILESVRNKRGQIKDFAVKMVNKEFEKGMGRKDLVGKLYVHEYPAVRQLGLVDLVIKTIETGEPQSSEYFYPYDGINKWFSCMFVKLGDGVVATKLDITSRKFAEEKIRRMEAEQRLEIFRVTLSTQEEERRRISENLHNGLGQLLYGIKLSLNNLTEYHALHQPELYKADRLYTDELLTRAIKETRRISHQLMPAMLHDYGLQFAIEDICKQFRDAITINCHIKGLDKRLDKYLELAVYRTIQELMVNVVKHASATAVTVELNMNGKNIYILVQDNGQGISHSKNVMSGIGMASIRSKIRLLNGNVRVTSKRGVGTAVEVHIPLPNKD